jgi:competence protein ComEC
LITLATLPLVAFHFNQVPWLGLIVNLLVIPFVGFVLLPFCLMAAGWIVATKSATVPAGFLIESLSHGMIEIVHFLADLPGAEWHVAAPTLPTMLLFYALGWSMLRLASSDRRAALRPTIGFGMALLLAWWIWSPRLFPEQDHIRVTFLDVGQGDGAVIELPHGLTMLVDGGAAYERFDMGRAVVAPFLWNRGIRHVDHVVGTHPQLDHVGGLAWVLQHFDIGTVWTNGLTRPEPFWQQIEQTVMRRHLTPLTAGPDRQVPMPGPCRLTFLNPPADRSILTSREAKSLNNQSVVTQLSCQNRLMLFTGDIEREALMRLHREGRTEHLTVLKVPHHGARNSLEPAWLQTAAPEIAVISAGRHNAYGHPAGEVLAAYRAIGTEVMRTDRQGAIWVDIDLSQNRLLVRSMDDWRLGRLDRPERLSDLLSGEGANLTRLWDRWNWR